MGIKRKNNKDQAVAKKLVADKKLVKLKKSQTGKKLVRRKKNKVADGGKYLTVGDKKLSIDLSIEDFNDLSEEEKEKFKEFKADFILPRIKDLFVSKDAIYPSDILSKTFLSLTHYEQHLYFENDGTLRPTTEYGHPRDRNLPRYSKQLEAKTQTYTIAKGDKVGKGNKSNKGSFSLTAILKALTKKPSKYDNSKTVARCLMEVMLDKSLKGDFHFFREMFNRIEGKVPDRLNISDPNAAAREAQSILEKLQEINGEVA